MQGQPLPVQIPFQPQIGHHGGDHPAPGEPPGAGPGAGNEGQDLIAVDQPAMLVGHHQPVGIAIQRQAEIRAVPAHLTAEEAGHRRAAAVIDVEPVRLHADPDHIRAQFPQHRRRHAIGRAIGAIDHDLQPVQPHAAREGGLRRLDIPPRRILHARGAAELCRGREPAGQVGAHQPLDLRLGLVGQLEAVRAEQLDAVILERVVGGRDHHAQIGTQVARQHGDGRRRQRPHQHHIHAGADEPRDQGRLDQIAGQPGVLADHHAMAMRATGEQQPGRLPQPQRGFRVHRIDIGGAANAVSAEQPSSGSHLSKILRNRPSTSRQAICIV